MPKLQREALLVVSDSAGRQRLADAVKRYGLRPVLSSTVAQAKVSLGARPIAVVICEETLLDGSFRDVLQIVRGSDLPIPVVVSSSLGDVDRYLEAMELGAFDFVACPYRTSELEAVLNSALRTQIVAPMTAIA
jgi:DNA-binding NtrC family response regulator